MQRRFFAGIICAVPIISSLTRPAAAEPPVFRDSDGRALLGYDTVAFWTQKKAVLGRPEHAFAWRGARWLFASPQTLAQFQANPAKYAPEFGCHCTVSMASGKLAPIREPAWSMMFGRLFFNYDTSVKRTFENAATRFIELADQNWKAHYANL